MNNVQLVGRLARDPEIRDLSNGNSVLNFTLAVNQRKTKSNPNPQADFISCVAWNGVARIISKYCKKGNRIGVIGRVHSYTYDGSDGKKRRIVQIIVREVEFLDSPHKGEQAHATEHDENISAADEQTTLDQINEVPF